MRVLGGLRTPEDRQAIARLPRVVTRHAPARPAGRTLGAGSFESGHAASPEDRPPRHRASQCLDRARVVARAALRIRRGSLPGHGHGGRHPHGIARSRRAASGGQGRGPARDRLPAGRIPCSASAAGRYSSAATCRVPPASRARAAPRRSCRRPWTAGSEGRSKPTPPYASLTQRRWRPHSTSPSAAARRPAWPTNFAGTGRT